MAGYNLKEGKYEERHVSDDELWSALSVVFTSKSVNDTSYKYGFLKAIIDNLYNVDQDLRLTFDQLFGKFGEIYWNLVLKYGLKQKKSTKDNRASAIERVLYYAAEKYQIREPIPHFKSVIEIAVLLIADSGIPIQFDIINAPKIRRQCGDHLLLFFF